MTNATKNNKQKTTVKALLKDLFTKSKPRQTQSKPSHRPIIYKNGDKTWLIGKVRKATLGGRVLPNNDKAMYMYTEIAHEYIDVNPVQAKHMSRSTQGFVNPYSGRFTVERNVIKIYFDKRNKEQLDHYVAAHGDGDQFIWFPEKAIPNIVITDLGLLDQPNEYTLENPNDFFDYAAYAVSKSYMVRRNWNPEI